MSKRKNPKFYDALKEFDGKTYSGMKVGGKHSWTYDNGTWNEIKLAPDRWKFEFISKKIRKHLAPQNSGAPSNTEYHWYILSHQKVIKVDANTYQTVMQGSKYKIGHKRPNWKFWSYNYYNESPEDKIIAILEEMICELKEKKKQRELLKFL
ncbi:MAG: hypothetical protein EAX96_08945 [Candidatus Lokiarchaeota archaeon]|nr:hypothetical protein [Candidatus Lokiarchaeota archaeon]